MGPGNPYWKRPFGSTGGTISLSGRGVVTGVGSGAEEVVVEGV